jgi:hypothetical protein
VIEEYQTMPGEQIDLEPFISYYYYINAGPKVSNKRRGKETKEFKRSLNHYLSSYVNDDARTHVYPDPDVLYRGEKEVVKGEGDKQDYYPLEIIRSDEIIRITTQTPFVGDDKGPCAPLKGGKVDIWHSNADGLYSGVIDDGTGGNNFLRGYQMTDDNGTVQFTTIYPGWYEGRAIHIHIKVRDYDGSNETLEWTSQFYLNNSINEMVHTQPPYREHGPVPMTNEEDFIYTGPSSDGLDQNNTGQHLMLDVKKDEQGYVGTFNVGVNATQSRE